MLGLRTFLDALGRNGLGGYHLKTRVFGEVLVLLCTLVLQAYVKSHVYKQVPNTLVFSNTVTNSWDDFWVILLVLTACLGMVNSCCKPFRPIYPLMKPKNFLPNRGASSVGKYAGIPNETVQRPKDKFAICTCVISSAGIARVHLNYWSVIIWLSCIILVAFLDYA